MMSSRSYRPAMTSAACRREIEKNSGIMYDPRVAAAALEHWDELVSRYAGPTRPARPTLTVCSWSTPARRTSIC